MLYKRAKYTNK